MNGQTARPNGDNSDPDARPATALLPDSAGDVRVAYSPQQLAFLALIAAIILAILRRLVGRRSRSG